MPDVIDDRSKQVVRHRHAARTAGRPKRIELVAMKQTYQIHDLQRQGRPRRDRRWIPANIVRLAVLCSILP